MIKDIGEYFSLLKKLSELHPENNELITKIDLAYTYKDIIQDIQKETVLDSVWKEVRGMFNGANDDATTEIIGKFKNLWIMGFTTNVDTCRVLTADEIVSKSEKVGAKFNKRTLYNYTASKCIPEPRRGAGYGGKWVEYKKIDEVWATIAWRMIHGVYPERNDTSNIIGSIKPPKTPPKTVGILHTEFMKRYKEYLSKYHNETKFPMIENYILENCWAGEMEKSGMVVLVLRGMMAWYIYSFIDVVYSFVEMETKKKIDEYDEEFYKLCHDKLQEISTYVKELSI